MTILKCRKCRFVLLTDYTVRSNAEDDSSVYEVPEDGLAEWMQAAIEEGGWTKGKLSCPKCACNIGRFDFVGGLDPPIHIIKSKVDADNPNVISALNCVKIPNINDSSLETVD